MWKLHMSHVLVLKVVPLDVFTFLIILGVVLAMNQYCVEIDMSLSLLGDSFHIQLQPCKLTTGNVALVTLLYSCFVLNLNRFSLNSL